LRGNEPGFDCNGCHLGTPHSEPQFAASIFPQLTGAPLSEPSSPRKSFRRLFRALSRATFSGHSANEPRSAVFAQFERAIIVERINAGLAAAKARGVKFGRKPTLGAHRDDVARLRAEGKTGRAIAAELNIPSSSVFKVIGQLEDAASTNCKSLVRYSSRGNALSLCLVMCRRLSRVLSPDISSA
jgi:hypothetical protein